MWRPFAKSNHSHLISGNRPVPPSLFITKGAYEIHGTILPSLTSEQKDHTLLTVRFHNVAGFHFSLRSKRMIVKVAERFGSSVGIDLENVVLDDKILLQANDEDLGRKVFLNNSEMHDRLFDYALIFKINWDSSNLMSINLNPKPDSISQLQMHCSGVLSGGMQPTVDLMGCILQRMTDAGIARPISPLP